MSTVDQVCANDKCHKVGKSFEEPNKRDLVVNLHLNWANKKAMNSIILIYLKGPSFFNDSSLLCYLFYVQLFTANNKAKRKIRNSWLS